MSELDTRIKTSAETTFPTPLRYAGCDPTAAIRYRTEEDSVRVFPCISPELDDVETVFERADPREWITGYSVRSAPACGADRIYCTRLAHAAMAGKTAMMVSRWSGHYVHVPLELVTQGRRRINPVGSLWRTVLEATGQPCLASATGGN